MTRDLWGYYSDKIWEIEKVVWMRWLLFISVNVGKWDNVAFTDLIAHFC